ncbi:AAA family ATPase [Phaeobacter sp. JH18-32]|uniref:AAA family ATPase n=1 Tax=Phaeobacter TaxID=302485 RepID=UPI003A83CD7E
MTEGTARHVILSGCSGGGKSTLLTELGRRGFATVAEPGRRIVAEEQLGSGAALPWVNMEAFSRRAMDLAREDRRGVSSTRGWVFFDRGMVDAAVALSHVTGRPVGDILAKSERYHDLVVLTPPWAEIYCQDAERQHGFGQAVEEYDRLVMAYRRLGYRVVVLPKTTVAARADIVLRLLGI